MCMHIEVFLVFTNYRAFKYYTRLLFLTIMHLSTNLCLLAKFEKN